MRELMEAERRYSCELVQEKYIKLVWVGGWVRQAGSVCIVMKRKSHNFVHTCIIRCLGVALFLIYGCPN